MKPCSARSIVRSLAVVSVAASASLAQLTDVQPGPNFTSNMAQFGGGVSAEVDLADIDLDGDLDVLIANNGGPAGFRVFINRGGAQGGTEGTFVNETLLRLPSLNDAARDIEAADIDGDGDLDLITAASTFTSPGFSRILINLGGLQGGALGVFEDQTEPRWRSHTSVPDELSTGEGTGPFESYSKDVDLADIDGDGDLDLFLTSSGNPFEAGGGINRLFLNDGSGVFDELFPWAESGVTGDVWDVELIDFDGDLDLDISLAERVGRVRVFTNNLRAPLPGATTAFTEAPAGAVASGLNLSTYEHAATDVDGDGDFDLWVTNYTHTPTLGFEEEKLLINEGVVPGVGLTFSSPSGPLSSDVFGDSAKLNSDVAMIDFDGDGDLDAFTPSLSSLTHDLYVSGNAQGLIAEFHRAPALGGGTPSGSSYGFNELGINGVAIASDADVGDLDGDGDVDIALASGEPGISGQATNRLALNTAGVPDTHAPTLFAITQPVAITGAAAAIEVQLRDNAGAQRIAEYDVVLDVSLNGGAVFTLPMTSQGGQQFRAVVADAVAETIDYAVRATDHAGNVLTTDTLSGVVQAYSDLGLPLAGATGFARLSATGTAVPGTANELRLENAAPSAAGLLFVSVGANPTPFKGGTLQALPALVTAPITTSPAGELILPFTAASGAGGLTLTLQVAIQDAAAVKGVALSNAVGMAHQ